MPLHACPQCHKLAFAWAEPERRDELRWACGSCGYTAVEDESRVSTCPSCARVDARLFLTDDDGRYRFCPWCRGRFLPEDTD